MSEQPQKRYLLTPWHRFLARGFEETVGRERVVVKNESPIGSEPPKVDTVLLRRETVTWTDAQRSMLPDGIRDTSASTILIEFKYTESLTLDALWQAMGYDYFYRTNHELTQNEVRTFVLCAKTPQAERLAEFGYTVTDLPGVYRSNNLYVSHITLLVLNELRDEPHNALVKAFASRQREKNKAFRLLRRFWRLSTQLLLMFEVLQAVWSLPEGATMDEILTPERVMEIGEEWKRIFLRNLPPEELDAYINPDYKHNFLSNLPPEELDAYINPDYKRALLHAGHEEGREEGREEGEKTGKIETLQQILQRRLGDMPPAVHERLSHCTLDELNTLVNPALDVTNWDEFMDALPK